MEMATASEELKTGIGLLFIFNIFQNLLSQLVIV
jgi:hypothetical protein